MTRTALPLPTLRRTLARDLLDGTVLLALALALWSGFALAISAADPAPERPAPTSRLGA